MWAGLSWALLLVSRSSLRYLQLAEVDWWLNLNGWSSMASNGIAGLYSCWFPTLQQASLCLFKWWPCRVLRESSSVQVQSHFCWILLHKISHKDPVWIARRMWKQTSLLDVIFFFSIWKCSWFHDLLEYLLPLDPWTRHSADMSHLWGATTEANKKLENNRTHGNAPGWIWEKKTKDGYDTTLFLRHAQLFPDCLVLFPVAHSPYGFKHKVLGISLWLASWRHLFYHHLDSVLFICCHDYSTTFSLVSLPQFLLLCQAWLGLHYCQNVF